MAQISTGRAVRTERSSATRESILEVAERLFAEHGVLAVSNRQISEAAGQGNNFAVGYHFGTKTDLVRAIVSKHIEPLELRRERMLDELGDSSDLRDWVSCLVRPTTEYLDALGNPTWFARFAAQIMTDPLLRDVIIDESITAPPLLRLLNGLNRCLPAMPRHVRGERDDMARHLIVQVTAERERALADGTRTHRATWHDAATSLIDAIVGVYLAPVTPTPSKETS